MKKPEELFKEHFEKFRIGLFKASLDHYLDTGTLSGSMLIEVRAMFESHDKQKYCADWNRCGSICEEQCPACITVCGL